MRTCVILLSLMAAGCAATGRGVPVEHRIDQAMKEAQNATPAVSEKINQALLPPLVVELPRSEASEKEQRFDIAVNSAPAGEVFAAIGSGSHWSIVVHPAVKESISLQLKNVTVFEALDTVRELYGYEYAVHGTRILIQPISLQTRVYQLNYLMSQREGKSETRVSSGAIVDANTQDNNSGNNASSNNNNGQTARAQESSRIVTRSNNDFWGDVAAAVKGIVGGDPGRSVIVNPQAGVLVVRALPAELRAVNDFLRTMQKVVARQVMLEAKIIEVQLRDGMETGINWSAFAENARFAGGVLSPGASLSTSGAMSAFTSRISDGSGVGNSQLTANPASPGSIVAGGSSAGSLLGLAFQTSNFSALLSFLESQGDLRVLSSPRIATINNQKAVLKVGTDEFFVTGVTNNQSTTSVGVVQNSPTITVQPFFSGVALDVTPQIDESGHIILHVHPSVSTVLEKSKNIDLGTAGSFKLPLATSSISESDTVVRVSDGNIVAIGGLMKETASRQRSGVPVLSDLPVAGHLFRNRSESVVKSELVILIKPTIILSGDDWKKDARATAQRLDELGPGNARAMDR